MKSWLAAHYTPEEAAQRWERTRQLDEKWIREEGTIGGSRNMMASNLLEAYAFFAFYEAVDRSFTKEDLDTLLNDVMGKKLKWLSKLDFNRLEKKGWLMRLIYRLMERYVRKADAHRGGDWGNTWTLNDFARRHGYIDFLPNLCAIDQVTCRTMHAALIRHETLAAGDGVCSYWILGDQDPEALADTGSK